MLHLVTYSLVMVLVTLHPALHAYPSVWSSVNGTAGQNLSISFSFNTQVNSSVYLYRNTEKVLMEHYAVGNHGHQPICVYRTSPSNFILHFRNLSQSHRGVYHLTVFLMDSKNPLIESNKVNLSVHTPKITSANTPTAVVPWFSGDNSSSPSGHTEHNPDVSVYIPLLLVSVSVLLMLLVTLALCFRIFRRKSGEDPTTTTRAAQQVVPVVSCVEYCVLDFQNRPPVPERVRNTEGRVEYASLSFPLRKTTAQDNRNGNRKKTPPQDASRTAASRDAARKPANERKAQTLSTNAKPQRYRSRYDSSARRSDTETFRQLTLQRTYNG